MATIRIVKIDIETQMGNTLWQFLQTLIEAYPEIERIEELSLFEKGAKPYKRKQVKIPSTAELREVYIWSSSGLQKQSMIIS